MVMHSLMLALALASAPADDGGRADYQNGTRYFEAEEFDVALPYFLRAYERSGKRPATIFALAQCERALKLYSTAIGHFEEYLATDPENKADVEETVRLLKEIVVNGQAKESEQIAKDAEAKKKADEEDAARRAESERRIGEERQKRQDAERQAEDERRKRQDAERQAELARLPAPSAAAPALVAAPVEPEPSVFTSPVFWIVTGVVVVGGAVTAGLLLGQGEDGYAGTSHLILRP